jgi:transposase
VLHELTDREAGLLCLLFPHLSGLDLDRVEDLGGSLKIVARSASEPVVCRDCGTRPARVHDRYRRYLQDLACGGRSVQAGLEVRRLICDNPACPVATFAEQVDGLTARHQRARQGCGTCWSASRSRRPVSGRRSRVLRSCHH